ncbi:hypothetical protein MLD38_021858 [Melastoma candidum]|uniref:Uncharacterized protein n=1 Tax=Melastoma candidum TaxID=119954 RepID=A0ACB9QHG1_9MYRT|nr:hypothetical protein MLD38_021858 [Melastoma candidum]
MPNPSRFSLRCHPWSRTFASSISSVKVVSADLSHCNTQSWVKGFVGLSQLADGYFEGYTCGCHNGQHPTKPGMTDLFDINAGMVKSLAEAVVDNWPNALVHIIINLVFFISNTL